MRILSYKCYGSGKTDLAFSKVNLQKRNLIVGASGSGKTRFLNTIFNASLMAVAERIFNGHWDITIEHEEKKYRWLLEVREDKEGKNTIANEGIWIIRDNGEEREIVNRKEDSFTFNGKTLPKLSRHETSISILKDEDDIKPLHRGFSLIIRRHFSSDVLEKSAGFASIPVEFLQKIEKEKDLYLLFAADLPLSAKLYVLSLYFGDIYEHICREFKATFPFVSDLAILSLHELQSNFHLKINSPVKINTPGINNVKSTEIGNIPVFVLKENNVDKWIALDQWSSGMQKVLLIITDILLLPADGGVYLLDEYENSLGVNAIHFLPSFLLDYEGKHQFFITSHHPYLINKIPVKNWFVFHRSGPNVSIRDGQEIEKRFDKSRQESFIQLINDPLYVEGVE